MKIINISKPASWPDAMQKAREKVMAGGLIIFPTETTYGVGVDATNQKAVDKLLSYKGRREGKPLSIAVPGQKEAEKFVEVNESAERLYQRYLPGPVTVVSRDLGRLAHGVASEFGTVGVRIPDYPFMLEFLEKLGRPLTATSANASGKARPYSIENLLSHLSARQRSLIDLILDAGELPPNPPSTVIDTTLSTPITLRAGEIDNLEGQAGQNFGQPQGSQTLTTHQASETADLAGRLLLKNWDRLRSQGLVIGLDGPLGAGKTIFAKGAAQFLQIKDVITSPTYGYQQEYDFNKNGASGRLYHLDLWKIDTAKQLERLELEGLVGPNQLVIIEWWQQVSQFSPFGEDQVIRVLIEPSQSEVETRNITIIEAQS